MGAANNKYCATILCTVRSAETRNFKRFLKRNPEDVGMDGDTS